ncbi:MAG: hypothetical protein AB7S26_19055 [Sandaracinaceae bacterium]
MFLCNYCGVEHDDKLLAREHVIPEALLNANLILTNTCLFWNNYFARSFESEVTSSSFMREVLRYFDPGRLTGKGAVYIKPVQTARGTTEHVWVVDGEEMLRDLPERETTNRVTIDAFDANDERHPIEIVLPFTYTTRLTGDSRAIADLAKKLEKERARIGAHLTALARDPSRDAGLAAELAQRNLKLKPPKAISFEASHNETTAGGAVDDFVPTVTALPAEQWFRFYMKVAWTYACLRLGREALMSAGGADMLAHLKAGRVATAAAAAAHGANRAAASKLLRDASIGGEQVWMWAIDAVSAAHGVVQHPELAAPLADASRERAIASEFPRGKVRVAVAELDRVASGPADESRFHSLRLVAHESENARDLVCEVRLFGGVFAADVLLGSAAGLALPPEAEVIRF